MPRAYRRHTAGPPALLELLDERADAGDALSATEVASRLGTSRGFVYAALRYGELQGFKRIVSGQFRVRIPVAELERYLAQHESQSAAS
jgi:excisionase family DNA binding protein